MRHKFQTQGGETVVVEITVDERAIARTMAARMIRDKRRQATALEGGIVATRIVE